MLFKVFGVASAILLAASTSTTAASTMLTSWYGPGFHGRLTANGEVYDQMGLTAAHKTLPFGTRLRVCYQECVNVRINDRGPYIGVRELDLSKGAAQAIGLIDPGVANVEITYL
jgi:rare lipoprotein A